MDEVGNMESNDAQLVTAGTVLNIDEFPFLAVYPSTNCAANIPLKLP